MALGLLCLGLTLLGILQIRAQEPPPALPLNPPLYKIPLQPDFQDDQFQGKWYIIAVADNAMRFENLTLLYMYSMTFQLKDDHSYGVTYTIFSEEYCQLWITAFVPTVLPGQFTLQNMKRRAKELDPELKESFLDFSKSLGLTEEDIVFTDPIDMEQQPEVSWSLRPSNRAKVVADRVVAHLHEADGTVNIFVNVDDM
ncbi:neutrophil gelatinase-associated lipocalin-like [Erethizon dorsatum]